MLKVVIIGFGNVGANLYKTLRKVDGVKVVQVYNRTLVKLASIASEVSVIDNLHQISKADVYIISVSDLAIEQVSNSCLNLRGLVVHTSGSTSIDVLSHHKNIGVLYPLQTFTEQTEVNFNQIPILLEAKYQSDYDVLEQLAKKISDMVYAVTSGQRRHIHLSAVMVNNFVNHLYTLAFDHLKTNDIPTEVIKPLMYSTLSKLNKLTPEESQTGPAIRGDVNTINNHLDLIQNDELREIYQDITNSIITYYGKKL